MKKETVESTGISIKRIEGVDCYESNGVAYLNLEMVALGLGITKTDVKNGTSYTRPNNQKLRTWLESFGTQSSEKAEPLPEYIPENVFYRLAMKAKNPVAEAFQAKVADEIIPAIRKTGKYEVPQSVSDAVEISGPFLRQLREKKGLTIAATAKDTGVNYYSLGGYERGDKKFPLGKAKRILVYNYLMSLPDAVVPLPTSPGLRYVTTVRTDPVQRRDYPVDEPAPSDVPALPITGQEFSELITKAVTNALSKAMCDAMLTVLREVQKRGVDGNTTGYPIK